MSIGRLIIIGAGDFGREVLWTCSEIPNTDRVWQTVAGFLDDDVEGSSARMASYGVDVPVIATIRDYIPKPYDHFICAIGDPKAKLAVCELLRGRAAQFTNIIHPSVKVMSRTILGRGVLLCYHSWIGPDVHIGDFVTINSASSCGHAVVVEDGCTISAHCDSTGHGHLERGVFLGTHAAVLPRIRVGAFAKIAAGSVAFRNVKPGDVVVGVPAKSISPES